MIYSMIALLFPLMLYAQSSLNTYEFHLDQIKNADPGKDRIEKIDTAILAVMSGKFPKVPPTALADLMKKRTAECVVAKPACLNIGQVAYWICVGGVNPEFLPTLLSGFFAGAKNTEEATVIHDQLRACSTQAKPDKLIVLLKALPVLEAKWPGMAKKELGRMIGEWRAYSGDYTRLVTILNETFKTMLAMRPVPYQDMIDLARWSVNVLNLASVVDQISPVEFRFWMTNVNRLLSQQDSFVEFDSVASRVSLAKVSAGAINWWINSVATLCRGWSVKKTPELCMPKWAELEKEAAAKLSKADLAQIAFEKAVFHYLNGNLVEAERGMSSALTAISPNGLPVVHLHLGLVKMAKGAFSEALPHVEKYIAATAKGPGDPWEITYGQLTRAVIQIAMKNYSQARAELDKLRSEIVSSVRGANDSLLWIDYHRLLAAAAEPGKKPAADDIIHQVRATLVDMPQMKVVEHMSLAAIAAQKRQDYKTHLAQAEKIWGVSNPDFVNGRRVIESIAGQK